MLWDVERVWECCFHRKYMQRLMAYGIQAGFTDELPVGKVLLLNCVLSFLEDSQIIDVTETLIPDILDST